MPEVIEKDKSEKSEKSVVLDNQTQVNSDIAKQTREPILIEDEDDVQVTESEESSSSARSIHKDYETY